MGLRKFGNNSQISPFFFIEGFPKGIYFLKMFLLSRVFNLSEKEKSMVSRVVTLTAVFYAKAWLRAPLSVSAARNDLDFHSKILKYRMVEPKAAFEMIDKIRRHLWYTTAQAIPLALADTELQDEEREELAKAIHRQPRELIKTGRPQFPELDWQGEGNKRPRLATLVNPNSWLMFQLLNLQDSQDWLLTPCSMWQLFGDNRKLEEFSVNLPVTNDLAERGVALISKFVDKVHNEEQRQALLQVVEFHRSLVKDYTKASLAKC